MKTEVKNAVVHHMHAVSKLAEIDFDAFGIYAERMRMTLQLTALMKEAFQNQMTAPEFDKRCAIILGSDVDAVAQLKDKINAMIDEHQTNVKHWTDERESIAAARNKAKNIADEYKRLADQKTARVVELENEVNELQKLLASQRESINQMGAQVKKLGEELNAVTGENTALKNAQAPIYERRHD